MGSTAAFVERARKEPAEGTTRRWQGIDEKTKGEEETRGRWEMFSGGGAP